MARRYYSSTAVATTLSGNVNNSTTSIDVTALSGFPAQVPWTALIDKDTASEEVVTVTNVSGTTLTVTRGVDGTTAVSHNAGATFSHGVSARDFDEANSHVNDTTTDVHGQYVLKSLVNALGDLVTATANDTPAILSVGSNGQMLMADSSATAGLRYVDPPANRNLIINGSMQVHQRATTKSGISSGTDYHTADRWQHAPNALGTWTSSVETDAPATSGLRKSLKVLCTTADSSPAAGDFFFIRQMLEGQDMQRLRWGYTDPQQVTLSFWVKSNVTGTYVCQVYDFSNGSAVSASYSVSASATWERKTLTFPASSSVIANDNVAGVGVYFWLAAGSDFTAGSLQTSWGSPGSNRATGQTNLAASTNNYWQVTGVQLETGPVATPFEFEPYEATLRKCQRYFERLADGATALGVAQAYGTTTAILPLTYTVRKRATPSITMSSASHFEAYNATATAAALTGFTFDTINALSTRSITTVGSSTFTAGHAAYVQAVSGSATIDVSAEL